MFTSFKTKDSFISFLALEIGGKRRMYHRELLGGGVLEFLGSGG